MIENETESPPRWKKGQQVFEVTVPADKTKSGRDEAVEFELSWEVIKTRRMSDRDWIQWEIERAREALDRAERALENEPGFTERDADALSSSLAHAITAWCRTHLGRAGPSYFDSYNAFLDNAPQSLSKMILKAGSSLHCLRWYATVSPSDAAADVRATVDAVLATIEYRPNYR